MRRDARRGRHLNFLRKLLFALAATGIAHRADGRIRGRE
jgi:hypothetical protein